jgi:hypothetical protein
MFGQPGIAAASGPVICFQVLSARYVFNKYCIDTPYMLWFISCRNTKYSVFIDLLDTFKSSDITQHFIF